MKLKIFIFLCILVQNILFADDFQKSLNEEELNWLKQHRTLKYSGNPKYLPYEAFENGVHKGMVADYLELISKKLSISFEKIPTNSWEETLEKAKNGEIDLFSNYTNAKEFKDNYISTNCYIKSLVVIVKQRPQQPLFISDLRELNGNKIAVGKKYEFLNPIFERYPKLNYVEIDTIENAIKGVSHREYDAALVTLNIATYIISKHGLRNIEIVGHPHPDTDMELGFHVKKEYAIFADILNKTLNSITEQEHQNILKKWTNVNVIKETNYYPIVIIVVVAILLYLLFLYRNYELKKIISSKTSKLSKQLDFFNEYVIASRTDLDGNITYVSDAFCRLSGYTRDELIGKNHRIFKHPDNDPKIFEILWKTISNNKVWTGVLKDYTKDKNFYWVDTIIEPEKDEENNTVGYIAIRNDVTAHIQLQELTKNLEQIITQRTNELSLANNRLQTIFDSASIGIILLQNRVIKQINSQACQMFGYSSSELIGNTTRILYRDEEFYKSITIQYEIIEKGEIAVWEQQLVRKDKSTFLSRIHLKAVDANDLSLGAVATIDDITLEHKALKEITEAKKRAEEATRTKGEFLANMSHEIRTPLNAIIGMTYLVLQTELDKQQRNYIEKMESASKNLLSIVNDILDFSKIEAGKMSLEHKAFYLQEVLENIANMFMFKAQEKGLKLLFCIDEHTPNALTGNYIKLSQILINLVGNAIKFTDNGEVIICIKPLEFRQNFAILKFEIKDSGIGLSKEQIQNLFQPFHQADGSITRRYGGTGLGLSISKHLAEMMEGEIEVESEAGVGSNFYFSVKLELQDEESKKELKKSDKKAILRPLNPSSIYDAFINKTNKKIIDHSSHTDVTRNVAGANILLVEDNIQNQEIAIELLKRVGVFVDIANNGQEALDKLSINEYDGVLMDCQLPIIDGYEATKIIRSQEILKDIPIIAMTANAMNEDIQKCFLSGMNDYLSKPIEINRFYHTIKKWIRPKNPIIINKIEKDEYKDIDIINLNIYNINIQKAFFRMGENKKLLFKTLNSFAANQKYAIQNIREHIKNNQKEEYLREVHTLKGLCGYIESDYLYNNLKKLEDILKGNELNLDLLDFTLSDIENELKKVIYSINENIKYFNEISHHNITIQGILNIGKIETDINSLNEMFSTLDSDAIEAAQNLARELNSYISTHLLNNLLQFTAAFDFEEAQKVLDDITKELNSIKETDYEQ